MFNEAVIKTAVRSIIKAIGDDSQREGLSRTPHRVAEMYAELFCGMDQDPVTELKVGYEHHLLPFYGVVHVGYIPNVDGRVVGISKLARVVEIIAKRPQIQERMATQIADAINEGLKPGGVAVVIRAEHLCMVMRGIKKPGASVITSALRGTFRKKAAARAEFMSLIGGK
jgi:GTP cyclohydrolase I